ncbi:carbohydrate ABC transporter permease [Candidatus Bipolaricaulota bacterium]|nr:carbohydrate ABC transporter permease [Candidatus Bipolaricaulota bacterium]
MFPARRRRSVRIATLYFVATCVLLIMISPYLYMLLQSLAPWREVDRVFFPSSFGFHSYRWLLAGGAAALPRPWLRAWGNSALVATVVTLSRVIVGALVGYALAVLSFRGRRTIQNFILFHMFYPGIILLVPTFLLIRALGLYDTYWAMILPGLVSTWAIFMYANFFRSIPQEVVEAARMDGASELRIIFQIMIPIARPVTAIVFLFLFMERWIELLWDMIVIRDPTKQTLNVLLATMFGPYGGYQGPLYAAGVLLTFPIIILFLLFSRRFVKGVSLVIST